MKTLKNRVIWVVGGGSGIGRAAALKASEEGAEVWVSGRRDSALKETAKIAARKKGIIHVLPCDASDPNQVKATVKEIMKKRNKIDSLIISIGWAAAGSIKDTSFETWKGLEQVHLDAMFLCCQEALKGLENSKYANIVIVGSIFGLRGKENRLAYCTMKGGVANFVRALALDLAGKIRVNSVCPGWVETEMSMSLVSAAKNPKAELDSRHMWHPMGRGGHPEEVADLCIYLTSDKASWVTGQNIAIDGGYTAR